MCTCSTYLQYQLELAAHVKIGRRGSLHSEAMEGTLEGLRDELSRFLGALLAARLLEHEAEDTVLPTLLEERQKKVQWRHL